MPLRKVILEVNGDPAFRSCHSDYPLRLADLIARARLKGVENPLPDKERLDGARVFKIEDQAINRRTSSGNQASV